MVQITANNAYNLDSNRKIEVRDIRKGPEGEGLSSLISHRVSWLSLTQCRWCTQPS